GEIGGAQRPADEEGQAGKDAGIGGGDEFGVRPQPDHRPAPCASRRSSVAMRRRLTSVCMASSCRVANRKVKAKNITRSGIRMESGIFGPSGVKTLAGWCSVLHQSTENLM